MRIGLWQGCRFEDEGRIRKQQAIDRRAFAPARNLVTVDVGACICLAMNLQFLEALLHVRPVLLRVLRRKILENARADKKRAFRHDVNTRIDGVHGDALGFNTVPEPLEEPSTRVRRVGRRIGIARDAGFTTVTGGRFMCWQRF